ncbi:bifunctional diguanylate cyclase/phosphodiesterase [Williamsia sp. CHRR-6]|uniref:sensor domain-containing protein n=1 Tax=Williamsia sp. CHRR-6 TaxID=2835871 RepID=UPI001BDA8A93|nr:diguanylate cyclase [Williamsia sp. CHRR-6]MBT0567438.1 diguanylate cyclase [Williamsia sp. CHRR-6]
MTEDRDEHWLDDLPVNDGSYGRLVDYPDVIVVHSDGVIVAVNAACVQWAGARSERELVGRPITDFVHPDSIPSMLQRISTLVGEGDASLPSEATMVRVDGSTIDVDATSIRVSWNDRPAFLVILRDVGARVAVRDALRYQEAVVSHVTDAVIAISLDGEVASWNPAAETIYRRAIIDVIGRPLSSVIGVEFDPVAVLAAGGTTAQIHCAADGSELSVDVAVTELDDGYVVVCSDKTALRQAERHFRTVVETIAEGILVVERDREISSFNPAAERIIGIELSSILDPDSGLRDARFGPDGNQLNYLGLRTFDEEGRPVPFSEHPITRVLTTGKPVEWCILGVDLPSGRRIWVSMSVRPMDPESPLTSPVVCSFSDIGEQRAIRERLEFAATHDQLTRLPNRDIVVARLTELLTANPRPTSIATLFIDIDRLKLINDSLGHSAGDRVIQVAARRLRSLLGGSDVIGRVGGDEFVAVVAGRTGQAAIEELTTELHRTLNKPFVVDGELVEIDASIGVSVIGSHDDRTADDILRDADIAMYAAKIGGRGCTQFYVPGLRERMRVRLRSVDPTTR